jgi:biotin carboxylase
MSESNKSQSTAPVVIVSACSAGALVAKEFARHRQCVHVYPASSLSEGLRTSIPASLFHSQFEIDEDNIASVIASLESLNPVAVVAASEWGVEIADQLAAALGLAGNDPQSTKARRDKFEMASYAAAADVRVAAQTSATELDALLAWYKSHPEDTVVVKPRDSAGSDNVFICRNESEVRHAAEQVLGSANLMRSPNQSALMQEYLAGDEYVINTVSHDGRHWLTDVWAVTKRLTEAGRNIYDFDDLVSWENHPELIEYTFSVLDAVGLSMGPGHTEVMITSNGPRLLETAARVTGAANPEALQEATGADQIELTVECHLFPEQLKNRPQKYVRLKNSRSVHLISGGGRVFSPDRVTEFLRTLPSFRSVRYRCQEGAVLSETVDVLTCPGAFFQVHENRAQIECDYRAFRVWESQNI